MVLQLLEYFDIELKIENAVVLIFIFSLPDVSIIASKMLVISLSFIYYIICSSVFVRFLLDYIDL